MITQTGPGRRLPRGPGPVHGPLFLSQRRPGPARRPKQEDLCPETGRARVLLDHHTSPGNGRPGWDLHQLRGKCQGQITTTSDRPV